MKLAIEVDASIHNVDEVKENDLIRQKQLEQEGLTFLRFSNNEIIQKQEEVIQKIETFLKAKPENNNDSLT